jgi:hypothetical protein
VSNRNNGNANLRRGKSGPPPKADIAQVRAEDIATVWEPKDPKLLVETQWGTMYLDHVGAAAASVEEGVEVPAHGWGVQPHGGYFAPPKAKLRYKESAAASKLAREADRRDAEAVENDPVASLEIIARDLTMLVKKRIKYLASKSAEEPIDKATMDALREFRQTLEVVNETRTARGAMAYQSEWLATVDTRFAEAAARMEEGPQPPVALPA